MIKKYISTCKIEWIETGKKLRAKPKENCRLKLKKKYSKINSNLDEGKK